MGAQRAEAEGPFSCGPLFLKWKAPANHNLDRSLPQDVRRGYAVGVHLPSVTSSCMPRSNRNKLQQARTSSIASRRDKNLCRGVTGGGGGHKRSLSRFPPFGELREETPLAGKFFTREARLTKTRL